MSYCPICKVNYAGTADEHIASRHDTGSEEQIASDSAIVKQAYKASKQVGNPVDEDEDNPISVSPLASLGVLDSSIAVVEVNANAGGLLSPREVKTAFRALAKHSGWAIDEANWIVQFLHWGFVTSFTEELEGSGGWDLVERVGGARLYTAVDKMFEVMSDKSNQRKITPRRFARFLAPDIPKIVEKNPHLRGLKTVGTPVSQRLGVSPELFLVVCSIYPAIKPFALWSSAEKAAHDALLRSATKEPRGDASSHVPQDLRINPEVAIEMSSRGKSDAHSRFTQYSEKPSRRAEDYANALRKYSSSVNTAASDFSGAH